ncbi:TRAF3-interacting protein 1 isoform X2 [Agrilus planipennis]|uniref:TRAF3-interacting protein 1 n=1 Tax=Agrilus planipennis TaxID=224129 RepID=A0A1W4WQY8_AGRPL|nr:TRAF3-interacting protein 1 isoform X1 [Agrilus planipennis]XP_025830210.1 TRAF3-interacting protein 1 isoform X2 [Agrilus planipennis]
MSDDINTETIKNTQKLLGKYVKKPALTEKLLRKPPFRFLHDVITCIIRDTGFLKGLYSEDELQSDNVKEKDAKLNFLTKLIDAMKSITGKEIKARPGKIIAGLEPKETNHLLQIIAKALDKKVDSSVYINNLNKETRNMTGQKEKKRTPSTIRDASSDKKTKTSSKNSTPRRNDKDNASTDRMRKSKINTESVTNSKANKHGKNKEKDINKEGQKIRTDTKESEEKEEKQNSNEDIKEEHNEKLETLEEVQDKDDIKSEEEVEPSKSNINENNDGKNKEETITSDSSKDNMKVKESKLKDDDIKNSVDVLLQKKDTTLIRPKSAKPKSSGLGRERGKQIVSNIPSENTEESNKINESNVTDQNHFQRPNTSLLRPPSVRPSSARPGAPRLKQEPVIPSEEVVPMGKVKVIIENFDKNDVDDEDTVTIQLVEPPEVSTRSPALSSDVRGHLVEQILEQLQNDDESTANLNKTSQVEIEWEQEEGLGGKDAVNKEIDQVRTTLQQLTKCANPLGKMLGYLHEDVDAMQAELNMWWESRKQAEKEIIEQKKAIEEEQKPLLIQLETVRGNIEKYKKQIAAAEANILQNERRIQNLLLLS